MKRLHILPAIFTLALPPAHAAPLGATHGPRQQAAPQSPATPNAQSEEAAEQGLWDSIKDGTEPGEFRKFLAKRPRGRFARQALLRLAALLGEDYASLFKKRLDLNLRWADVEAKLRRRADLIPGLYESIVALGVSEPEFFGQIVGARSRLLNAVYDEPRGEDGGKTPAQKGAIIEADNAFTRSLKRLDAMEESYPQMRSDKLVTKNMDEMSGVENRIYVACTDYNEAAEDYNNALRAPATMAAAERHGFTEEPYFKPERWKTAEPKFGDTTRRHSPHSR